MPLCRLDRKGNRPKDILDDSKQTTAAFVGGYWLEGQYADLNRVMVEEAEAYIPELVEAATAAQQEADLALAQALLAKDGLGDDHFNWWPRAIR